MARSLLPVTTTPRVPATTSNRFTRRKHRLALRGFEKCSLWARFGWLLSSFLVVSWCISGRYSLPQGPSTHSHWDILSPVNNQTMSSHPRIIVVVPTYYGDLGDVRYQLALDCCAAIAAHGLEMIVVDASPQHETIRQRMTDKGQSHVHVVRQTEPGRKGAALRQGIDWAVEQSKQQSSNRNANHDQPTIIAFQEPEKADMIRFWKPVVQQMIQEHADIIVPTRSTQSFHETYPIEQFHSETFANLHLNTLGQQQSTNTQQKHSFPPNLDWTMGPVAIRADTVASHYLSYKGDVWDMQLVPLVRAYRWHGRKVVASHPMDYQHPVAMKRQEEGIASWNEKRLVQLNFLFEHVGNAWKEPTEGGGLVVAKAKKEETK